MKKIINRLKNVSQKSLILILPLTLFFAGWWFALPSEGNNVGENSASAPSNQEWTCSMHPQIRQGSSGLCPICNMDLIPLEAENSDGGLREVSISPEASSMLDLRVTPVQRATANMSVELFGKIDYDERSVVTTTARISGRLDRLYADFTGTTVSKGDAIAKIYSPELYVAQQELIQAVANSKQEGSATIQKMRNSLLTAAREKLRLLELTDEQIKAIEKQDKPSNHITLTATQDGVIVKLNVKEGSYVKTGQALFSIANLDSVWLQMEAFESDLPWLRYAQSVHFTVNAIPGEIFTGRIAFIDPQLDPKRRIINVRVNVDNKKRLLKPGMFAHATAESRIALHGRVLDADLAGKWISPMHPEIVKDHPGKCDICGMPLIPAEEFGFIATAESSEKPLLIPSSAVLRTGKRAVVYVRIPDEYEPVFEGREIVLGPKTGDHFIVLSGISEGELVVTSGAFKLDSELQIKARPSMMNPNAGLVERSALNAPGQLAGQWSPLLRYFNSLEAAVKDSDSKAIHLALDRMQHALHVIQHDQLQPKEQALWKEFSMRLNNTLTAAGKMPADRTMLATVRNQIDEVSKYLGLPSKLPAQPDMKTSPQETQAIQQVTTAYLTVSEALSSDKLEEAKTTSDALSQAITRLPDSSLKKSLVEAVTQFQKEEDIKQLRAKFKPISDTLIKLVKQGALDQLGDVYIVHCPMANQGDGADWLSGEPLVKNPYFGSSMYSCGTITDTLSLKIPDADHSKRPDRPKIPDHSEHEDHTDHSNHSK
jgi:Cu(I)/Ag(I) efflux system membrane fusion protein